MTPNSKVERPVSQARYFRSGHKAEIDWEILTIRFGRSTAVSPPPTSVVLPMAENVNTIPEGFEIRAPGLPTAAH